MQNTELDRGPGVIMVTVQVLHVTGVSSDSVQDGIEGENSYPICQKSTPLMHMTVFRLTPQVSGVL